MFSILFPISNCNYFWRDGILMNGSTVKNHISLNTVFEHSATQRTSFLSWFLVYQRVLPQACPLQHPCSRQEIDHPTSSPSSSTSPTMTSSTVSSDSVIRRAREDLCGTDSYPVAVSRKHVERRARRNLLTKPTKNPKPNKNEDHDLER